MQVSADVVVVGAGIVGLAVALEGTRRGHDVVLVGPELSNGAASPAAGAMLGVFGEVTARHESSDEAELLLRLQANAAYDGWVDGLDGEAALHRRGTTVVATTRGNQDRQHLRAIGAAAARHGARVEEIDPLALGHLRPSSRVQITEALFLPDEGHVDTPALLKSLNLTLNSKANLTRLQGVAQALASSGDRVTGVVVEGETIEAGCVVVAAGADTTALLASLSPGVLDIPPVLEGKGTSLVLQHRMRHEGVVRTPNREFACGLHAVPRGDETYIGATNRVSTVPNATGGTAAEEVHLLLESAIEELDASIARASVLRLQFGRRPISADRRPLIGSTSVSGLHLATGTYRNGVLLAPEVARLIFDDLEGVARVPVDFSPIGRTLGVDRVPNEVMARGSADLLASLLEPGGYLPYGRSELAARALGALLMSIVDPSEAQVLRQLAATLLSQHPIDEVVPELFLRIAGAAVS